MVYHVQFSGLRLRCIYSGGPCVPLKLYSSFFAFHPLWLKSKLAVFKLKGPATENRHDLFRQITFDSIDQLEISGGQTRRAHAACFSTHFDRRRKRIGKVQSHLRQFFMRKIRQVNRVEIKCLSLYCIRRNAQNQRLFSRQCRQKNFLQILDGDGGNLKSKLAQVATLLGLVALTEKCEPVIPICLTFTNLVNGKFKFLPKPLSPNSFRFVLISARAPA